MRTPDTAEKIKWLRIRFFTNSWLRIRVRKKCRILPESTSGHWIRGHIWIETPLEKWSRATDNSCMTIKATPCRLKVHLTAIWHPVWCRTSISPTKPIEFISITVLSFATTWLNVTRQMSVNPLLDNSQCCAAINAQTLNYPARRGCLNANVFRKRRWRSLFAWWTRTIMCVGNQCIALN